MAKIKVVPVIPGCALTSAYDNEPVAYGQALLPNVIDPAETAYKDCCVGTYIYRSVGDDYQTKVPYANHIKGFTELNAGAHYYVMSGYSSDHRKASATVNLWELYCNPAGNRTGFVSLSLVCGSEEENTMMRQCDIGLAYRSDGNEGAGWYPTSWAKDWRSTNNPKGIVPYVKPKNFYVQGYEAATKLTANDTVEIVIEVNRMNGKDYVTGTIFKVYSASSKTVFARVQYCGLEGDFFIAGKPTPYVRFTRFMSLVPNNDKCTADVECTDYADWSELTGIIRDCKIDDQPWDSSKIAFAWSVQTANISTLKIGQLTSPSIGSSADECHIVHCTETHGTPTEKTI